MRRSDYSSRRACPLGLIGLSIALDSSNSRSQAVAIVTRQVGDVPARSIAARSDHATDHEELPMFTFPDAPLLSLAGDIRFDVVVPEAAARREIRPLRALAHRLRQRAGLRGPTHALLADAQGVWAWSPDDRYAAATRHGHVRDWMRAHPGSDLRLWVAGDLTHGIEDVEMPARHDDAGLRSHARKALVDQHGDAAASWPLATWRNQGSRGAIALAGIDLDALRRHGHERDVRIRSVAPWWHHAFLEARRCVAALARAPIAHVCVVEGRSTAWITLRDGALHDVRRCVLDEATIAALRATIARWQNAADADVPVVVLGQGLADGGDTSRVEALVLGRLDGEQPPQWLRPATQLEVH
jgi:hypothetical protein